MRKTKLAAVLLAVCFSGALHAQTVYPIDRATILSGSKFDVKVEFDGVVDASAVEVTVNGQAAADYFGQEGEFVAKEDGEDYSTLWFREVMINDSGDYAISATDGKTSAEVNWSVYTTPEKRVAKNVIVFIGDGLSIGHRTGARILSRGISEGKYHSEMAMDAMSHMSFLGTSSTDSIAADSANTMSAMMSGHKTAVNAIGVYVSRSKSNFDHPRHENLARLIGRTDMSFGVVSDAEIEDATPAATLAYTRSRYDKPEIVEMFYDVQPEVILGGGSAYFLPQSTPGSKRKDEDNYVNKFMEAGYTFVSSDKELQSLPADTDRLLGLFHTGNMDTVLDRRFLDNQVTAKFPNQPDLTTMTQKAIDVLSQNDNGFVLVVESSLIDKASHPLDWERAIASTIMLDQSVEIAQNFAKDNPDTLIIVTGDHTHGIAVVGTVDDAIDTELMRDKVGTYGKAGYPNYEDANQDGYPDKWDVSKRLAVFFNNYPDHYETWRPKLDAQFQPALKNEDGIYVANEAYKDVPGAVFREGNLPRTSSTGVHSVDDLIAQAQGPGAEAFHGFMENSEVFKAIVDALALNSQLKQE